LLIPTECLVHLILNRRVEHQRKAHGFSLRT
jgi:hypothetical protein